MSVLVSRLRSLLLARKSNAVVSSLSASASSPATSTTNNNSDPETQLRLVRHNLVNEARREFDLTRRFHAAGSNSALSDCVKRRDIVGARKLFDEMPERDSVSWNLMISAYTSCRCQLDEARKLFDEMPERDSFSWNTMISGYAKHGHMSSAVKLFNRMAHKDRVSWNALITGFLQNFDSLAAVRVFESMPGPGLDSLNILVSGLVQNGELDKAERVLSHLGDQDLARAYNTLIAGYGQQGRVEDARRIFKEIPSSRFTRNLISWNSMIMCYLRSGDVLSARKLFDRMSDKDTFTWNSMINCYVRSSDMDEAMRLFDEMRDPDMLTWNSMVSGFARIGNLDLARVFFERTPEKNLVSWNTIISGHEKNEDYRGSMELFFRMRREQGASHDYHTLSSALSACVGLESLSLGMQIHQLAVKTLAPDTIVSNSLITMYSRCGEIGGARLVFEGTGLRDVISWNAMIGGLAAHGLGCETLERFAEMKRAGLRPTWVTFLAVLNACANSGLVEEGTKQFGSMTAEFRIEPSVEHYASLVHLLARAGDFEKAMDLIAEMAVDPDRSVWGALLGACGVHRNAGLGRVAAEALARVDPESSAPYVVLYNIYADLGLWDDAENVRSAMEENNITKEGGFSLVDSSSRCLL